MATRKKTLRQLARDGTFLARRHAERLVQGPLEPPELSALQLAYAAARRGDVRGAVARAFELAVRGGRIDVGEKDLPAKLAERSAEAERVLADFMAHPARQDDERVLADLIAGPIRQDAERVLAALVADLADD